MLVLNIVSPVLAQPTNDSGVIEEVRAYVPEPQQISVNEEDNAELGSNHSEDVLIENETIEEVEEPRYMPVIAVVGGVALFGLITFGYLIFG